MYAIAYILESMLLHTYWKVCYRILFTMIAIAYMKQVTIRTPKDIGALIRDRRQALGLDQAALAEHIGVGRLWVNQVERGKPGASLALILRALAAVNVEVRGVTDHGAIQPSTITPVISPDINAIVTSARSKSRR
jgi:HTH-type transcriptional regulator / antitoxin HipB